MNVVAIDDKEKPEPSLDEAKKRIKEKAKEIRERAIVPPVDEDEPLGIMSGGPEHLDTSEDDKCDNTDSRK